MHLKSWLTIIIILLLSINAYSQDKIDAGFHITPTLSKIEPSFPQSLSGSAFQKSDVIDFGFDIRYFFTNFIGIESGLGMLTYKSKFKAASSTDDFETIDSENVSYEREINGTNISETAVLRSVNLPVHLVIKSWISKNLVVKVSVGPGIFIPVQNQSIGIGTFSYIGYYPSLAGVHLDSIPEEGFNKNVPVNVKRNIPAKFINVDFGCSLGINYSLNNKYELFASVNYSTPITNTFRRVNNYHISNELGSYYTILSYGNDKIYNLSFSVGIQMNFGWFPKFR